MAAKDDLSRAYATLGVARGASLDSVRSSYKALVRKWHPDRFAGDPQGRAEASVHMRAINDAFRAIAARLRPPSPPDPAVSPTFHAPPRSPPMSSRRLTREEIDRMVEAMKNDGPLDWLIYDEDEPRNPAADRQSEAVLIGGIVAVVVGGVANLGGASAEIQVALGLIAAVVGCGLAFWKLPPLGE